MRDMNTMRTLSVKSISSESTEQYGELLGHNLKGGETIELVSDVGGGKTTLTRGIVRAVGSGDRVASPTFTISKLYKTDKFDIHHFDFYRLAEAGIVAAELDEVARDPQDVLIVEWGDIVQEVLPAKRITVRIERAKEEDGRNILFTYPEALAYLVERMTDDNTDN
jgi:tRNA threonylcarbamoyladenosine biosynthesis protein TsaE